MVGSFERRASSTLPPFLSAYEKKHRMPQAGNGIKKRKLADESQRPVSKRTASKKPSLERVATPKVAPEALPPSPSPQRKRYSTVYDAVAGRVAANNRFLSATPYTSRHRDTASSSTIPVPPDEVLFRRKNAPPRYEEDDIYWADRHLLPHQRLPNSDLLKAIHRYVSAFYTCATENKGVTDVKSFDETALLCMGILLEETAVEVLGSTGDLAFTEAADEQERFVHGVGNERSVVWRDPAKVKSGMVRKGKSQKRKAREEDSVVAGRLSAGVDSDEDVAERYGSAAPASEGVVDDEETSKGNQGSETSEVMREVSDADGVPASRRRGAAGVLEEHLDRPQTDMSGDDEEEMDNEGFTDSG